MEERSGNGRYCESEYEQTFLGYLEQAGWQYLPGDSIRRSSNREVLYADDMEQFLRRAESELTAEEIRRLIDKVRFANAGGGGSKGNFATLHMVYGWMVNGVQFTLKNGQPRMIALIDFEEPKNNIFRAVNQFTVEYTDRGEAKHRRPDILLYVNGMPLCVIELKNPAEKRATVYNAWRQITVRYWRDIPQLLHYCPLACISDGVHTRLGTVRAPYEHFYAWRRADDGDAVSGAGVEETKTMIDGVFETRRFLEIFRDYVYFQDDEYDADEQLIVCRYPQFFAARLLKRSIIKSVIDKSGKGGTYFGATGCGKTYTMAFLARQLALRCTDVPQMGSPTIVLIVDREDLQKQGAKLFTKSKTFLNLGEVSVVGSRKQLRDELGARDLGGFYICTIQKFCDRKDDKIGLLSERSNIICFSDEAHRTQTKRPEKVRFGKDKNDNMRTMVSRPYAEVLREAFPHATFVGFTGTPVSKTYETFGAEIDRYTMDQAVADGLTVPIKYHPRITRVLPEQKRDEIARKIEEYYSKCAEDGVTEEEIRKSEKAMSSMEAILGDPTRLKLLARDIHHHFESSRENDPGRVQKAMIVCASREIAYGLLKAFRAECPDWFTEKKAPDGIAVSEQELRTVKPMPFIAMAASVKQDDEPDMYNYLGGRKNAAHTDELAAAFKNDKSNLSVAIVVDMWLTGFDVPSLTYMYNDKPLQKQGLIQTISRVNRKYPGKEYGLIVDYIGIRENMLDAARKYGGKKYVAPTDDDAAEAAAVFSEVLAVVQGIFEGFDLTPFLVPDGDPAARYELLGRAAEHIFASAQQLRAGGGKGAAGKPLRTYFLENVRRLKAAYDVSQPAGKLSGEQVALAQCFMAIAGFVGKMSGSTSGADPAAGASDIDAQTMNRRVTEMVRGALEFSEVESVLEEGESEDVFRAEYFEKPSEVKMPASRLELLMRIVRRQISEYGKTNQMAAKRFQQLLEETIEQYHERRKRLTSADADATAGQIIEDATARARQIQEQMAADRESFRKVGLSFEEKAFYDILLALRDQYRFAYGEDVLVDGVSVNEKCKDLAKQIRRCIDARASIPDWLRNQNVRDQLKYDIKICMVKSGYPPERTPEAFRKIMEQVDGFAASA